MCWLRRIAVSPYRRIADTAELALAQLPGGGASLPIDRDERLRDRENGLLDQLTWRGIQVRHPFEADRATRLGRFYYRSPGGESWADVMLRIRSYFGDVARDLVDERLLISCRHR